MNEVTARRIDILETLRHARHPGVAGSARPATTVKHVLRFDIIGPRRDDECKLVRGIGNRMECRLQTHGHLGNGARLEKFDFFEVNRGSSERLQNQFDVTGCRHDGGVMNAMVRQPREVLLRKPRLEEQVVGRNPVSD